jgi:2'-5' RNA ligase
VSPLSPGSSEHARPAARADGRHTRPGSEHWRLFLALPVPPEAAAAIHDLLAPWRERYRARWLPSELYHVTLRFLGDVAPGQATVLRDLAEAAASSRAPFAVGTGRADGRTRAGESLVWLALDGGGEAIAALARALADPGTDPGRRAPHLTVARRADPALLRALTTESGAPAPVTWTADRVVLVRSHLSPSGPTYETLEDIPLSAPA